MLFRNKVLLDIKYSLENDINISRLQTFEKYAKLPMQEIIQLLQDENHGHLEVAPWQKVLFPIWCWKSFIRDKHEAFRFKYDTVALNKLED